MKKTNWKKCAHTFGPHTTLYEPNFNVAYGSERICTKCGAIELENWCETRASGGIPRIYPPKDEHATN